jgi:hypothetical protein
MRQQFQIEEKKSCQVIATFVDETGGVPTGVTGIKADLYDVETGSAINSRTGQSVFNVNGGVYNSGTGVLTLTLDPADNVIVNSPAQSEWEKHRLLLQLSYGTGRNCPVEVDINVHDITKIT